MDSESDFVASTLRERVEFENLNESGMKMKCNYSLNSQDTLIFFIF